MKTKYLITTSILASLFSSAVFAGTDGCLSFQNSSTSTSAVRIDYVTKNELDVPSDGSNIKSLVLAPGQTSPAFYLDSFGDESSWVEFQTTFLSGNPFSDTMKVLVDDGDAPRMGTYAKQNQSFSYSASKDGGSQTCSNVAGDSKKSNHSSTVTIVAKGS